MNGSRADFVYETLENDILSGIYPRGEILTELKLCERLGVSRTPVREALNRLKEQQLVEETSSNCCGEKFAAFLIPSYTIPTESFPKAAAALKDMPRACAPSESPRSS